jgi:hypothetical protein
MFVNTQTFLTESPITRHKAIVSLRVVERSVLQENLNVEYDLRI